jgi:hypothetical protein
MEQTTEKQVIAWMEDLVSIIEDLGESREAILDAEPLLEDVLDDTALSLTRSVEVVYTLGQAMQDTT